MYNQETSRFNGSDAPYAQIPFGQSAGQAMPWGAAPGYYGWQGMPGSGALPWLGGWGYSAGHPSAMAHLGNLPAWGMGYGPGPVNGLHSEIGMLSHQLSHLCHQAAGAIEMMNRLILRSAYAGMPFAPTSWTGAGLRASGVDCTHARIRETESHLFFDFFLPHFSVTDVDLEVNGNRLVARTKVPVVPAARWWVYQEGLRGMDIVEYPDGRVELCWVVPVSFQVKDIEATCREGWFSICIPKTESQRQTIKVSKDTRRAEAHA